ncbi:MAG: MFS transporter [Cyanobacteria bacterium K_DeepCast_35m_m2_023]|nr:MFS transporter [Cyanobacteria bacterium K_DeepCast_35m_m2_023]
MTADLDRALAALRRHLLPFLFVLYVIAYLDRVNVSYAAAGVSKDLGLNSASYGFAAGIFFLGYVLLEIPSNLILDRVGARRWIGRILLSWGVIAALMAFMTTAAQFNGLRLLLGVAEAGFFPGIILYLSRWVPEAQRARTLAGFMLAIPVAGLLGGPLSAALLSMHGWLSPAEADALEQVLQQESQQRQSSAGHIQGLAALWGDRRLWLLAVLYLGISTSFYGFSFWIPRFVGAALA